jgi:hypothetical protein
MVVTCRSPLDVSHSHWCRIRPGWGIPEQLGGAVRHVGGRPGAVGTLSALEREAQTTEDSTAYLVTHFFEGGAEEQYQVVVGATHPGGFLPAGQTYHAAGPTEGGWLVLAVWDSKDACDRFVNETLMPTLTSVSGGFSGPPRKELRRSRTS